MNTDYNNSYDRFKIPVISGSGLRENAQKFGITDSFISDDLKQVLHTIYPRKILKMFVVRSPVEKVYNFLLNIASAGRLRQALNNSTHDTLFHLFLVLVLDTGTTIRIERNERFSIGKYAWKQNEVALPINIGDISVGDLFENYKNMLGSWNKIILYDPVSSNCQHFVAGLLKSSNLLTTELSNFILQDLETLLKGMDGMKALVRKITALGLMLNISVKGKGLVK